MIKSRKIINRDRSAKNSRHSHKIWIASEFLPENRFPRSEEFPPIMVVEDFA